MNAFPNTIEQSPELQPQKKRGGLLNLITTALKKILS